MRYMSYIYAGIDLGTNSIKLVVCEKNGNKYHVLACTSRPSSGIKNGFIVDMKSAVNSCRGVIRDASELLGMKKKFVVTILL